MPQATGADQLEAEDRPGGSRLGRSAVFYAGAAGTGRVLGLVREVVAAGYFGVRGPMSAFTIAHQIPDLVRNMVAEGALIGAFVPVFTGELEADRRREAFRLASTLLFGTLLALTGVTAGLVLAAPLIVPLVAPGFDSELTSLCVGLSRLLFPLILVLGVAGLVTGILNSYGRFALGALSPAMWNVGAIAGMVGLVPVMPDGDEIYAYAIGLLAGTTLQLGLLVWDLRRTPFQFQWDFDWRSLALRRVLTTSVPVSLTMGLIYVNFLVNSVVGTLVSDEAPAAIDKAARIYLVPQGIFAFALAAVIFPTLSRLAARGEREELGATIVTGIRQLLFVLLPAAALMLVLPDQIVSALYERGEFDAEQTQLVSPALSWFAIALPLNGVSLVLARALIAVGRVRQAALIAAGNVAVTAIVALALHEPFGIAGIASATAVASAASVLAQWLVLRSFVGVLPASPPAAAAARAVAASAVTAGAAYAAWKAASGLTDSAPLEVAVALLVGSAVYLGLAQATKSPELDAVRAALRNR